MNDDLAKQLEIYKAAYKREKQARKEAESVLEDKVRSLYLLSNKINSQFKELLKSHERFRVLQNKMIQSKKMETFGEVFSGILHEINNPLASINSNIEFLAESKSKKEIEEITSEISQASERISLIVNSLATFKNNKPTEVSIQDAISMAIDIAKCKFNNTVTIKKDYASTNLIALASKQDLIQLFLQILINCDQHNSKPITINIKLFERFGLIVTHISDNGKGIDTTSINNLFDPFYTTNPLDKKGIGLYSCYQICQKYQGRIKVYANENEGLKVSTSLPKR